MTNSMQSWLQFYQCVKKSTSCQNLWLKWIIPQPKKTKLVLLSLLGKIKTTGASRWWCIILSFLFCFNFNWLFCLSWIQPVDPCQGALRTQTWKSILDGDVQAYTAKEDSNKVMLTSSLFAKVIVCFDSSFYLLWHKINTDEEDPGRNSITFKGMEEAMSSTWIWCRPWCRINSRVHNHGE